MLVREVELEVEADAAGLPLPLSFAAVVMMLLLDTNWRRAWRYMHGVAEAFMQLCMPFRMQNRSGCMHQGPGQIAHVGRHVPAVRQCSCTLISDGGFSDLLLTSTMRASTNMSVCKSARTACTRLAHTSKASRAGLLRCACVLLLEPRVLQGPSVFPGVRNFQLHVAQPEQWGSHPHNSYWSRSQSHAQRSAGVISSRYSLMPSRQTIFYS